MEEKKKDSDVGLVFLIMLMVGLVLSVMGLVFCVIKLKEEKAKNNDLTVKQNNDTKIVYVVPEDEEELEEEVGEIETENSSDGKYTEITEKLEDDDIFVLTTVEKGDEEYTLKGVIYTKLTMTKEKLEEVYKNGTFKYRDFYNADSEYDYIVKKDYDGHEYAFIYDLNGEEKLLMEAVEKDDNTFYIKVLAQMEDLWETTNQYKMITVPVDMIVKSEESLTVKEAFENFKDVDEIRFVSRGYKFEFENEKCEKIIELILSV